MFQTSRQLDSSLARLRRVASGKGSDAATVSEVCNNMTRLRGLLEEERVRFKGAMVQMKQKHTVAVKQSMVLGKAVVEVGFSLNNPQKKKRAVCRAAFVPLPRSHSEAAIQPRSFWTDELRGQVSEELQRSEARAAILEKRIGQVLQMLESAKTGEVRRR
jgi:hypothetical protein